MNAMILLSALVLGGLHAIEPGHGKTVVAAYLVGSRGRVSDAVILGGVVTFTHTSSVIVLGLLTALAGAYLVPETVHRGLEVISGLLVVGVGLWMVWTRMVRGQSAHGHTHGPHGEHLQEQEHGHTDAQVHQHSHDSVSFARRERATLGGLVALGISGGMVPCPAALALLLAAVALGDVLAGVSLVIIFSLGLAAVLIAIGIMLVKSADLAGRRLPAVFGEHGGFARWAGSASAVVVTLLGIGMTVRAAVDWLS